MRFRRAINRLQVSLAAVGGVLLAARDPPLKDDDPYSPTEPGRSGVRSALAVLLIPAASAAQRWTGLLILWLGLAVLRQRPLFSSRVMGGRRSSPPDTVRFIRLTEWRKPAAP